VRRQRIGGIGVHPAEHPGGLIGAQADERAARLDLDRVRFGRGGDRARAVTRLPLTPVTSASAR
jgi:hypothetical protein